MVRSETTLGELAPVLEAAMGWLGGHLHSFEVGGTTYGTSDPDWGLNFADEDRYRLPEVLPFVGSRMRWEYDFGGGWEHNVLVEAIGPLEAAVAYPFCMNGRRACPPEGCGGPWSYAELLELLADPTLPDENELRGWASGVGDPEAFDPDKATAEMRSRRRHRF